MSLREFLTEAEVAELTGYRWPSRQREVLDANKVFYYVPKSGKPKVPRRSLGPQAHPQSRPAAEDGAEGRALLLRLQQAAAMDTAGHRPSRRQAQVGRAGAGASARANSR